MLRFSYVSPPGSERRSNESAVSARSSFSSIQSILPSIGLTKRRCKHLDAIQLVREQRQNHKQELAYQARPFVLCGIPLRRPPSHQLTHRRHSGKFFLEIVGHSKFGLPYGQDRLIPIWIATLALQQKSRVIGFENAAQILDFFRLPRDGPHYRRLIEGFQRLFTATIFFGTDEQPDRKSVIEWARFHFFDHLCLWSTPSEEGPTVPAHPTENAITLSEGFYTEIDAHRIPVEREVVAALAHAPGILDFYIWVVWRSWTVKAGSVHVPVFGAGGLNEQLGTRDYSLDRRFRHTIRLWLDRVKLFWPECPATLTGNRQFLVIHSARQSPAVRAGQKGTFTTIRPRR